MIIDQPETKEVAQSDLNYSSAEKMMPKYCTSVQVGLLNSGNIVLSMIYKEQQQAGVLIERVVIDLEHANNLADVLKSAVTQSKQGDGVVH